MSTSAQPLGRIPAVHPEVARRRLGDLLVTAATVLVPAVTALAVTIAMPNVSIFLVLGVVAGLIGIVALMVNDRLEITVTLVVIYLGVLNGPVKMFNSGREVTASIQDIVVLAVAAGALLRIMSRREKVRLPALSGWVIAWVALVLVNAFNPKTEGVLHALGGFRNQLQWVPAFFFGYALMRSKDRFRKAFILIGVIALLNGVVAAYQTTLTPQQLASWGPGYAALIHPTSGTGRIYFSEGEARVRPPGLGAEAGSSGAWGHIALPMCLALLAITRRRRWFPALLCVGAALAVMVGLGRLPLIGALLGVGVFMGLAALGGRRFSRTMVSTIAVFVLLIPAGALVVSALKPGTFKRYESLSVNSETTLHKENAWSKIPKYVAAEPLGFGLGNSGPIARIGGGNANSNLLEGHGLTSETQYNVLVKELGVPGLLLWPAIIFYAALLTFKGIRRIRDPDLAICLAGMIAPLIPLPIEGTSGYLSSGASGGAYYWFAFGVVGYWFAQRVAPPEHPAVETGGTHETAPALA
jgi:hypothetical protein